MLLILGEVVSQCKQSIIQQLNRWPVIQRFHPTAQRTLFYHHIATHNLSNDHKQQQVRSFLPVLANSMKQKPIFGVAAFHCTTKPWKGYYWFWAPDFQSVRVQMPNAALSTTLQGQFSQTFWFGVSRLHAVEISVMAREHFGSLKCTALCSGATFCTMRLMNIYQW